MRRPLVVQVFALATGLAVAACGGSGKGKDAAGGGSDTATGGRGGAGGGAAGTDGSAGAGGSGGSGGTGGGTGGSGGTGGRDASPGSADARVDAPADAPRPVDSGSQVGNAICPTDTTMMCSQADVDSYNNCLSTACDSTFKMCFGDVKNGMYDGPCGPWVMCTNKCACNDNPCRSACPQPNAACIGCLLGPGLTCQNNSGCVRPACYGPAPVLPDGGGLPTLPDGGFTLPDGGFPPLPDGGLGGGTCADLLVCCNGIADAAMKAMCIAAHGTLSPMPGGDASCGALLTAYRFTGICQ